MTISLPNSAQTAGVPTQWDDTITATPNSLVTGDQPALLTQDLLVAASQTIPERGVVGFDANGRLVPAVSGGGSPIQAIGIALMAITTDASTTYKGLKVYRGGCFNPDLIAWPASYDTEAEKINAFNGAPTPTNIIVRRPRAYTI